MAGAGDTAGRARAWRNARLEAVCDVVEPWAHGRVMRATGLPSYWDFNVVLVENDPATSVAELVDFADEALAGLEHRRFDFDRIEVAERLRSDFEASGWESERLVWMLHGGDMPPGPEAIVAEVPYDEVIELRRTWHAEDFPDHDPGDYFAESREISMRRGARVLASFEDGAPVAYAQLEQAGDAAEIVHVYVDPQKRGSGRGTALTRAAVHAADEARDLWIVADDEDRPKELYARLGFRPAWTMMEFLRLPPTGG